MAHRDDWEALEREGQLGLRKLAFWHGFAAGLLCLVTLCLPVSWFVPEASAWTLGAVVLACSLGILASVVGFLRANRCLNRNHQRMRQNIERDTRALIERLDGSQT